MKTKKSIITAALLLTIGMVSCQKEEASNIQFTAGLEQSSNNNGTKTYLDGTLIKWDGEEQVKIYGVGSDGATYSVTPHSDDATWATLNSVDGILGEAPYKAIYPASIAESATSITLPGTQYSTDGSLTELPMYAESSTNVMQFKNLCGALKLHLQQSGTSISRIEITANTNINGTYDIDATGDVPMLVNGTNGSNTTELVCTTEQDISEGHDFFINLPASGAEGYNLKINIYRTDGFACRKSCNGILIERSKYATLTIGSLPFSDPNLLPGTFSVSSTKQVRFSRGNLMAITNGNTPSAANTTWTFHQNQYDMLSTYDINGTSDRFGYSTADTYYGLSTSGNNGNYYGRFVDWGTAFGVGSSWRTLNSSDSYSGEMRYLLFSRSASTVNGVANARYALFRLNDGTHMICGILLFPDTFTWPDAAGLTPSHINTGVSSSTSGGGWDRVRSYTIAQFEVLEDAGCVFLPIPGNTTYYYWTSYSSSASSNWAYPLEVAYYGLKTDRSEGRSSKYFVRLVQDAN